MSNATSEIDAADPTGLKAILHVVLPTGDAFDRELTQSETRIGKSPGNDIVIADPAVSTSHVVITAEPGAYIVIDVGSRNGTYVAGERLSAPRRLNHGDVISIGRSKITFRLSGFTDTEAIEVDQPELHAKPPPLTEDSLAAAVVAEGLIDAERLASLRASAGSRRLYRVLIEDARLSQPAVRDLMSRVFQIAIAFDAEGLPEQTLAEFPARLALELNMVPISKSENDWTVVVADPTDAAAIEELSQRLQSQVDLRLATIEDIELQLTHLYGPKLVGVLPSGARLEFTIKQREVRIGKAQHNDIVLSDPTVSSSHAIILDQGSGYEIVDLDSRNGTFVDDERLGTESRVLIHGDNIRVGRTLLAFRSSIHASANTTATLGPELVVNLRKQARVESDDSGRPPAEQAARAAPEPSSAGSSEVSHEKPEPTPEEKKKKKKKSKEDRRMRAAWIAAASRILAQVLGPILLLGISVYVIQKNISPGRNGNDRGPERTSKVANPVSSNRIQGGPFEASGVVQIPDTDGELLFVDDGNSGSIFWIKVDQLGKQIGSTQPVSLGVSIEDPESITYGGGYFYVLGSQANPTTDPRPGLVRFRFDPGRRELIGQAEAMTDLLSFLMTNTPELGSGPVNFEGLAWDPVAERLLLGLRSPLERSKALIVTLKLINPAGPISAENLAKPETIKLSLDGFGIRDIEFDTKLKAFLILSGASEHHQTLDFRLWEWNGDPLSNPGQQRVELDPEMKPEGVTHVRASGKEFVFIVGDSSRYTKSDYTDAAP